MAPASAPPPFESSRSRLGDVLFLAAHDEKPYRGVRERGDEDTMDDCRGNRRPKKGATAPIECSGDQAGLGRSSALRAHTSADHEHVTHLHAPAKRRVEPSADGNVASLGDARVAELDDVDATVVAELVRRRGAAAHLARRRIFRCSADRNVLIVVVRRIRRDRRGRDRLARRAARA